MKKLRAIILLVSMVFALNVNAAVILSMMPGASSAMSGDSITLDLMISGLGDGAADSLGDFDLDVSYDASALSVSDISVTSLLGDIGLGEALDLSLGDDTFGIISLSVISLLFDFELDALQTDSFSLASITFMVDTLAEGASTVVGINEVFALGDVFGDPLNLMNTSDAVIRNVVSADEPALLGLLCIGLLAFTRRKLR